MGIGSTYIGPLVFVSLSLWVAYLTNTPTKKDNTSKREHTKTLKKDISSIASKHYDLIVGVMSARNHFQQRNTIRDTWMKLGKEKLEQMRIKIIFIVGDRACAIPEEDRINEYTCQWWNYTQLDHDDEVPFYKEKTRSEISYDKRQFGVHKWSFRVQRSVILTKLGIHKDSLSNNVVVKLLDAASQSLIVDVTFNKEKPGTVLEGYRYKPVEQYFLPKGFEGTVVVENIDTASGEVETTPYDVTIMNVNVANSLQVLEGIGTNFPAVHYRDTREWNSSKIPLSSFVYKVHEPGQFEKHVKEFDGRFSKYKEKLLDETVILEKEINQFNDILLVNVTDVYRNIPLKVIRFFSALAKNMKSEKFDYVLKTDDDCFVDLKRIHAKLKLLKNGEKIWWGRFRHNWVVERFGKWSDVSYPAQLYPQFACGAGYVLSQDLVKWLYRNRDWLKLYQGEDVSQGVWLSAVGPQYVDDPMWQCEHECISNMYAMPDLKPDELASYWANHQKCGDACGCD